MTHVQDNRDIVCLLWETYPKIGKEYDFNFLTNEDVEVKSGDEFIKNNGATWRITKVISSKRSAMKGKTYHYCKAVIIK